MQDGKVSFEPDRQTVGDFLDHWLEAVAKPSVRPTTHLRYSQVLASVKNHLGKVRLVKLTSDHVEWCWAEMEKAGNSLDARHKAGVVLGTALQWAVEKKKIPANPVRAVPKKIKPRPGRPDFRPLDAEQTKQFLAESVADRLYPLYVLALDSASLPIIRFHDLRHTCASLLLLANENRKVVSERLGHSKIEITLNIYQHLLPTMQDGAAQKMERLLSGGAKPSAPIEATG